MKTYSIFDLYQVHSYGQGCSAVAHGGDPQDRADLRTTRVLANFSVQDGNLQFDQLVKNKLHLPIISTTTTTTVTTTEVATARTIPGTTARTASRTTARTAAGTAAGITFITSCGTTCGTAAGITAT